MHFTLLFDSFLSHRLKNSKARRIIIGKNLLLIGNLKKSQRQSIGKKRNDKLQQRHKFKKKNKQKSTLEMRYIFKLNKNI